MANIKSSKKRAKTNEIRRIKNLNRRSELKTSCKKVEAALVENNVDLAKSLFRVAESKIAQAKGKKLVKANTAARKISRLAKRVKLASK